MRRAHQHLRDTFLAGIFAGVPIVVTVLIINWVDEKTQILSEPLFHRRIPLLGIAASILLLYLIGLAIRSFLGRQILGAIDSLIRRIPIIRPVYEAWKQVSLIPGGTEGTFSRVVLVPVETGDIRVLGFTSGLPLPEQPELCAVLIPNSPNPITGRLYFVPIAKLTFLTLSPEEGLKLIVSTGNYIPRGVRL